jgi:NAD-dependent dihydropyrimidine dehydrogenase PreA subunit
VAYVIGSPCLDVKERSCVDVCPVDCIYEGARKMYIHPAECIDCGACEAVCPVEAIHLDVEVPEPETAHIAANAAFFAGLGPLGGARSADLTDRDCLPEPA